ncbi:MAG: hypothetical protein KDB00_23360, partial [Planctomycetales bacterium]|nr:hypothetical protein [Planctomycetales bacterium]
TANGFTYIILLTAKLEKDALVSAMDAGADDFLIKPCDHEELRVRIREGERIIRLEQTLADQNRQLRQAQAALVQSEKLASLGQLAAGMAHEINNPISFISNNLAVLRRDVASLIELLDMYRMLRDAPTDHGALIVQLDQMEKDCDLDWVRENLPKMFSSSIDGLSRIRDLVKNLRDFARLDEAELGDVDINQTLRSTLEMLSRECESSQVVIEMHLQDNLPTIVGHPAKINQVLYNLVLNAIQASEVSGEIDVATFLDAQDLINIEIKDQGCGIKSDDLERIFEPFYTTKPVGQGTGLGLAASYGIVRDHGGTIEVESVVDHGATFRLRLPLRPTHR